MTNFYKLQRLIVFFFFTFLLLTTQQTFSQSALSFTGTSTAKNYVTFGTASSTLGASTFTLECWIKRATGGVTMSTGSLGFDGAGGRPNGAYPIITKGMGEGETPANINTNYFLGITVTGVIGADFEDNAGGVNHPVWGTTNIPIGEWHHITATYDVTNGWHLYLDGNPETLNGAATAIPGATPEATSIQHAALGAALSSTGTLAAGYFAGIIDEPRIWGRALSQTEIQTNINQEVTSGTGLLGRWGLNEGTGTTVVNSVPGSPNGTLSGTSLPTWEFGAPFPIEPKELWATRFTGTSTAKNYVTFGTASSTLGASTFTLECWIKRATGGVTMSTGSLGFDGAGGRPNGAYPIITKGMGEGETPANINTNYFLGITVTGVIGADFEDNAGGVNHPVWGTTNIPIGEWHHITATYDVTNGWHLYLDGNPETLNGAATAIPGATPEATSIQHAALGAALSSTGTLAAGYFAGIIDEPRIWGRALSQTEIQTNINQEVTSGTGLLGRWGLNEGTGTTVVNSVPGSPNGTLSGTSLPTWEFGAPFNISLTVTPPAAPTGLSVTAPSAYQVNLMWTDNSDNENNFEIERSTTGSDGTYSLLATVGANTTSYSDATVSPANEYCYRVSATNSGGASSYAGPFCVTTPAEGDYALDFGTGTAYVTFGNKATLGLANITLETWFKREGSGTSTNTGTGGMYAIPLVTKGRGEAEGSNVDMNYFLGIRASDNVLAADFEEGASGTTPGLNHPVYGTTPIVNDVWYHAAATYDGTSWYLYLNGNLEGQLAVGQPLRADCIQYAGLGTAMNSTGVVEGHFDGVLDEVRIWNYARAQSDIQATINSQITNSQLGLVARWGLNEELGTTVNSGAGTIVNGTITGTGSTWVTPGAPFNWSQNIPRTLTVDVIGAGLVTKNLNKTIYDDGEVVTITAIPAAGWALDSWSGDLTGNTNPTTITMNGDKNITATFTQLPYTESVTFAAFGDFGDDGTNEASVAALVKSLNPSLILTTGDNNYNGATEYDNVVGSYYGQYIHYPAGSSSTFAPGSPSNAFYPTYGNHDADYGFATQSDYFDLPGNERYYKFTIGPVEFFAIDSDPREPDGYLSTSTQAQWLQTQLAASTAEWKVIYMHHSPFSSCTSHGSTIAMQWPFEDWGVDAVFSAHDHVYERILRDDNSDGKQLPYLVTGAGGHSLYSFGTPVEGSLVRYNANYGTMLVDANSESMIFNFYSIDGTGTLIDSYTLWKNPLPEGDYALDLGSNNAYVTFGAAPSLATQDFTAEAWFLRTGTGTSNTTGTDGINIIPILTKGSPQADGSVVDENYILGINTAGNVIGADFEEGTGSFDPGQNHPISGTTVVQNDIWYHAAVTFSGGVFSIYLNGVLENSIDLGTNIWPQGSSTQHSALGTMLESNGTPHGYFAGIIDEARIWNYARTQAEILSTINTQLTTAQTGLLARWGLNEGSGTTVFGSADTGVTGNISGSGFSWPTPGAPFNINTTTTISLQDGLNGYAGTRDTYIEQTSPSTIRGGEPTFVQDINPSDERRSLLLFDLTSLPSNITIESAELQFFVSTEGQGFNMYRMLVPWDEATVTYSSIGNRHFAANNIDAEPTLNANWPGVDAYTGFITVTVPSSTIQNWIDGTLDNNGWLMIATHADDGQQLDSRENGTQENNPMLTITYSMRENQAPEMPIVVAPTNGSTGVLTSPTLEVSVSDPEADALTVRYYGRQVGTNTPGPDFTIVALPDAQYYTDANTSTGTLAMFTAQTNWCVSQRDLRNIVYVAMEGDITNDNLATQWENGVTAMQILETPSPQIPYGIAMGNHDQEPNPPTLYNNYFGISRFAGRPYYGGHYGSDNNNNFNLFSASGMDFIVINLGFGTSTPSPEVFTWANDLLQNVYPDRRAIVVSHDFLSGNSFTTAGQAIYNALRGNPNLFLMLGGHLDTEGLRTDVYNGNTIYTVRSDYQSHNGGNGWLRLFTFSPTNNQITVSSYSPSIPQSNYSAPFNLPYTMSSTNSFVLLNTQTGIISGSNVSFDWSGLTKNTEYDWYVEVSDGNKITASSIWSFTTEAELPVELSSFTANIKGNDVLLSWKTETEVNNYGFDIERKIIDGQWQKTGFVNGNGNSNSPKTYSYTDKSPMGGSKFLYRLKQVDNDGQFEYSEAVEVMLTPMEYTLYQNYPNPFNPSTKIKFTLPEAGRVVLKIYDMTGAEVAELVNTDYEAGYYDIELNATNLASGIYFYQLRSGGFVKTNKMILMK